MVKETDDLIITGPSQTQTSHRTKLIEPTAVKSKLSQKNQNYQISVKKQKKKWETNQI